MLLPTFAVLSPTSAEEGLIPSWAETAARAICHEFAADGRADEETIATLLGAMADTVAITNSSTVLVSAAALRKGYDLTLSVRLPGSARQRTRLVGYDQIAGGRENRPAFFVQAGPQCRSELGRAVAYDSGGKPETLTHFAGDPLNQSEVEPLNPEVPAGVDPGGVAVAQIDSGINYLLPEIARRLARDETGAILGADLFDNDGRPFDLDPRQGPLFPRRHGTVVASVLIGEAPRARLIPLRYPGKDAQGFAGLVERIAATPARIVTMPLGGYRPGDWKPFAQAAARHPEILFVVSAGNDGRDIDALPVFPAAFANDNFLVVTSTNSFGRFPRESNWGQTHVDLAVPAERIPVIDHRGARGKASGTSYAVPRVAALAARFAAAHPNWNAARIKAEIIARAVPLPRGGAERPVRHGWLPNPALIEVD